MRIKQIIYLAILLNTFSSINLIAQNNETIIVDKSEYLKGLTKATAKELKNQKINLDRDSILVYDFNGKRMKVSEVMDALMSGNYHPDFYIDKNKEIKVAVLRLKTEEDKEIKMEKTEAQMSDRSKLIRTDATDFTATDLHGNEYSLKSLKGKIIVLNFWFVECKPCVLEMPDLNKLVENYKDKDVVFLGFARNDKSKIDSFLKRKDFSYNIIPNSKKIAKDYKVTSYPTHIIIDENSKIVYSTSGLGSSTISEIEKTIEILIEE